MRKDFLIKLPAGLILLLGLVVIVGWLEGIHSLVSLVPGYINMVFNAALCFVLAGLALLLPDRFPKTQHYGRILLGALILLIAGLTLSQDIFNYNLGLDQFFIKALLPDQNPFPGRMAHNTAISFVFSGLTLILLSCARHRLAIFVLQVIIFTLVLISFVTFAGYLLHLEFLYPWYAQMAVHAALGFTVLSIGLWGAWSNSHEYKIFYQGHEDKKILFAAALILLVIASVAGFSGFAISSTQSEDLLKQNLQQLLKTKTNSFIRMVNQPLNEITDLQNDPLLQQLVLKQGATDADKLLLVRIANARHIVSMEIFNNNNLLLTTTGNPINKADSVMPLNMPYAAKLLWHAGLYIRFTVPIIKDNIKIGYFVAEWPLDVYKQIIDVSELGRSAELVICNYRDNNYANCLPTSKTAQPFTLKFLQNDQRLPMWYALLGQAGVMFAKDYHYQQVIAAYNPIADLGIGMVTKINTEEIYLPIRAQLQVILPLVLLAIIVGLILLYWQVLPLIRRITLSEKRLTASQFYLQAIINNMADGIVTINQKGKIESVNPKIVEIFKYKTNQLLGNDISVLMPLHLYESNNDGKRRYVILNGTSKIGKEPVEITAKRQTGEPFSAEITFTKLTIEDRQLFVGIVRDISARKAAAAELFESELRFRTAFDDAAIGMAIVSLEGRWLEVNQALCDIVGYSETELLERDFQSITHPEDLLKDLNHVQQLLSGQLHHYTIEKRYLHKNGSSVWILLSASLIRDTQNKPLYFIAQIQDITGRKQAEVRLKAMAYSDALTGLANRVQLESNLNVALSNAFRHKQRVAVIFLDLDDFKNINDSLGHDAGDQLLQTAAQRLKACVRATDTVARMGGDEFVLLITEAQSIDVIAAVAQKIIAEITNPISVRGYELHITTSIGISCYPDDGQTVESLLKNADMALYRAKLLGRNNFQFCTKEMTNSAQEKLTKEQALRQALSKNEFILYYQPIVDISSKKIVGVEALLRWDSPEFGLLGAEDIIPLAEDTGLIYVIGDWVFKNACGQLRDWQVLGLKDLRLSINISARQFKHLDFVNMIKNVLKNNQMAAHYLEFQITESLFVNNPQYNLTIFHELTQLGVKIAIDNFGTGYSSLSYMQQLVINRIIVDRTFILAMTNDQRALDVVKAAIAMASQLNIKACAEGIEKAEQFNLLVEYGCSEVQGYFISAPLPIEQITTFLLRHLHSSIKLSS